MKLFFQQPLRGLCLRLSLMLSASFLLATSTFAQVEVVEAGAGVSPNTQQTQSNTGSTVIGGGNDVVMSLYLQLETLQQEVQTLRGIVEEQSYQIKRMQTESRDRYIDIDNRLSGQFNSTNNPPQNASPAIDSNLPATNVADAISARGVLIAPRETEVVPFRDTPAPLDRASTLTTANSSLVMPVNAQDLYRTALNLLVEDSNYEDSISMFQQYINVYPTGRYLSNAYYWQGEALILVERYNQAKEAFMFIVRENPEHSKAPGALLKLVVTYIQMGDSQQAEQSLSDLRAQYPGSLTEISAAEDYLRRAGN